MGLQSPTNVCHTAEGESMKYVLARTSVRIALLAILLASAMSFPRATAGSAHGTPVPGSIHTTLLLDMPAYSTPDVPTIGLWRQTLDPGVSFAMPGYGTGNIVFLVESGRLAVHS